MGRRLLSPLPERDGPPQEALGRFCRMSAWLAPLSEVWGLLEDRQSPGRLPPNFHPCSRSLVTLTEVNKLVNTWSQGSWGLRTHPSTSQCHRPAPRASRDPRGPGGAWRGQGRQATFGTPDERGLEVWLCQRPGERCEGGEATRCCAQQRCQSGQAGEGPGSPESQAPQTSQSHFTRTKQVWHVSP